MKTRHLLPPGYLLIAIVTMLLIYLLWSVTVIVDYPWCLLGILPLLSGIILNLLADAAFRKNSTPVSPEEVPVVLITSGAYGICRHPMYLGMTLILLGIALLFGVLLPFLVIPAFVIFIQRTFVIPEEEQLEALFGPAWLAYRENVRQWI